MEIWKDIPGYDGAYQVSNTGKIRSVDRTVRCKDGRILFKPGVELKPETIKGYEVVKLSNASIGKRRKTELVSRLVAKTYLQNEHNYPVVNHMDGNTKNNNDNNLEWCTQQENVNHAWRTGLSHSNEGEDHHNSKLSDADVSAIRMSAVNGETATEIAKRYNISLSTAARVISGQTYQNSDGPITKASDKLKKYNDEILHQVWSLRDSGYTFKEIADRFGVSKKSIMNWCNMR